MSITSTWWPCDGIDDQEIDPFADQRLGSIERILADADRRADAQSPRSSLVAFGILDTLLDVLDGNQPFEVAVVVDDRQLLDLVLRAGSPAPGRASCRPGR